MGFADYGCPKSLKGAGANDSRRSRVSRLTESAPWALPRHPAALAQVRLLDIFWVDSWRFPKLTGTAGGLFIDYSKNLVTAETLGLLFDLGR